MGTHAMIGAMDNGGRRGEGYFIYLTLSAQRLSW